MTPTELMDIGLNEFSMSSLEIDGFILMFVFESESVLGIDELNNSCAWLCAIPPEAARFWLIVKFFFSCQCIAECYMCAKAILPRQKNSY